jgi:hypothetical protein
MYSPTTEFLAEELKKLVGWGAAPQRLPFLPTLRGLAGVDEDAPLVVIGYQMRRYLVEEIDALSGTYRFMEKEVSAEKLRRAYRLLMAVEGSGHRAPRRRGSVIMLLGQYSTPDTWRRPTSPEFDLLMILADHMIRRHNESSTAV